MIYKNSTLLLKYQKTVAKLVEFGVNKDLYPKIEGDYRKLSFPTIFVISEACRCILDGKDLTNEQKNLINFSCEYYDAAFKAQEIKHDSIDFLLEAIVSYILNDDFGSAYALFSKNKFDYKDSDKRLLLIEILDFVFLNKKTKDIKDRLSNELLTFLENNDLDKFIMYMENIKQSIYFENDYIDAFYFECSCAVVKIFIENSSKRLLPGYSNLSLEKWNLYFAKEKAVKILWPSQKLVCEKNILNGSSALIQLPTGVGKTKTIELIIESLFLSGRGKQCLIVAPLRALCNQISDDLSDIFSKNIIKKISDILEEDYIDVFENKSESIIICTPEKLQFILHHNVDILDKINLLIFDECHMFDDPNRGALFELLLSIIKEKKTDNQQIVLISAVLSNAQEIAKWFFGDYGVVAYDENIKSTPKSIGFINSHSQIVYYSRNFSEYDFFIPNAYEKTKLQLKKKCKKKFFPENKGNDYSIYLCNKLCVNGGVALYVPRRSSIISIIKRLIDVNKKGIDFSNLTRMCDSEEMDKFVNYFNDIYGEENIYSQGAHLGVLPHYSSLGFGLKNAIEESLKLKLSSVIICTSTLAQGVNIPVKYLILSNIKNAQSNMSTRNFQNLLGRIARSGTFTEGSVIITDPNNFDEKDTNKFGEQRWNNVISKFDIKNAEPCSSCILKMFSTHLDITTKYQFFGAKIVDFIIDNLTINWGEVLFKELVDELQKKGFYNSLIECNIKNLISLYVSTINQLETEMCYSLCAVEDVETINLDILVENKCRNLFAYYLGNDDEKNKLQLLLKAILCNILENNYDYKKIGVSLANIRDAKMIQDIIAENNLDTINYSEEEILKIIIDFVNLKSPDSYDYEFCCEWINGKSYFNFSNHDTNDPCKIERVCSGKIAYDLSFLIGNMIDFLPSDNVNQTCLLNLQKQLKYGVKSKTAILFCEEIVNDRHIANLIDEIIGFEVSNPEELKRNLVKNKEKILNTIKKYPTYFKRKICSYIL